MRTNTQDKSLARNIIKNIGVIFLNASVFAVGMVGGGMIWLMLASGYHYWIDFCALFIGFALTFKTSFAMYEIARYPKNDLRDAPKLLWQPQWAFIRGILISSAIIIPIKICANIVFSAIPA